MPHDSTQPTTARDPMPVQTTKNDVERTQREIETLSRRLTDETKKEADRTDRILRAKQTILSTRSQSTIQSKLREITQHEKEVGQIQKRKADLTKKLTDKTARLHDYQRRIMREQRREHEAVLTKLTTQQKAAERERLSQLSRIMAPTVSYLSLPVKGSFSRSSVHHDAFISYATEDKESLVRPLAEKLTAAGFNIWVDELQLTVGDSLRRSIDKGLATSRFGIVVLSPDFFAKDWPQYELDGLVNREVSEGTKVILPLWHKVSKDEVRSYSPSLADKVALSTGSYTLDELVVQLGRVLRPSNA